MRFPITGLRFSGAGRQLLRALLALGCMAAAGASTADDLFTKSSVNLPSSIVAFEVNSDLDGDGLNDAFAVYQRRIMVFFQTAEGKFPSAPDIEIGGEEPIPAKYAAVAIGKVSLEAGRQLLLIGSRGVDYVSFANLKSGGQGPVEPRNLIAEELTITSKPELSYLNCATDMDGDGTPELVLPVGESLAVYASSDGTPYQRTSRVSLPMKTVQATSLDSEPLLLGSAFFSQPGTGGNVRLLPENGLWHSVRFATTRYTEPLLVTDYNVDRRMDMLSAGTVRYQQDDDTFASGASNAYQKIVTATVPHESRNVLVTAPNIADFNADKIWDTYNVNVTAAKLSPRTDISVYLGSRNRAFPAEPSQVLRTRDFAYSDAIPIGDINNDGAQDIALFHLDFQPSSMQSQLKAYLRNGLQGDLRFYLWDKKNNRYPESPSFKHPVTVSYEIYGARQFFRQQVTIDKDLTGDGFPDLVLKTGATEFSVFENQKGSGFGRSPLAVVSTAPTRFSSIQTLDVNQDSRADVVISGYLEDQEDRIIYSIFTSRKN
jgi:hypothetical protein